MRAADRISDRLARQALWDGEICNWEICAPDRAGAGRSKPEPAGCLFYQGASGIAWFLAEAARVFQRPELARAAKAGLLFSLREGAKLPPDSFGFHSGRVGIAWAAARAAEALDHPPFFDEARRLIEPLQGMEARDQGLDVIAGAAGAIPALLDLSCMLDVDEPRRIAEALGDHLIQRAHHEPDGWSWPMLTETVVRHLAGLAHGAAGAGAALLELAFATGETRFHFAAEGAFLYERRLFNSAVSNWPDLRNIELSNFVYYEGFYDQLVALAREKNTPPYHPQYMAAWCHGSPGIGLTRLRAYELTNREIFRRESLAALASTMESLSDSSLPRENFSLCHGSAGNCDLPLLASEVLGDASWRERVVEVARYGLETYEDAERPWSCGTVNSENDPSLMLGEAGIGLFYLRLARPEIPSPLLLRPTHERSRLSSSAKEFAELARASADEFFSLSRRAVERIVGTPVDWTPPTGESSELEESPAALLHAALQRAAEGDETLQDACRLDFERWQASAAIQDFSAEFIRGLALTPWEDLALADALFQRAEESRLTTLERDWPTWLDDDSQEPASSDLPPEDEVYFLLYRRGDRIHSRQVGALPALLLDALEQPLRLSEILAQAAEAFGVAADSEPLRKKIVAQLEELFRAGFVVGSAS